MEIGTRVEVKPGYLHGGRTGVIREIIPGNTDRIASVEFDGISRAFRASCFLFKLRRLDKPKAIKLKKFSAWK